MSLRLLQILQILGARRPPGLKFLGASHMKPLIAPFRGLVTIGSDLTPALLSLVICPCCNTYVDITDLSPSVPLSASKLRGLEAPGD
jgi:hypothetical protein